MKEQNLIRTLSYAKEELQLLEDEIESYDFKSFQEIFDEIQCIKCSNEYVQEAFKDPNHFLRVQVADMER